MGTRKYYFRKFSKHHPVFHVVRTSKQLIAVNDHIVKIFTKYAKKSYSGSPRQILYLMTQNTASLFVATEGGSTSPKVKSSPEPSSPGRRKANVSSLKRKQLQFVDSTKSANLENDSPIKTIKNDSSAKESTSPSGKAKMSEKSDTGCPTNEFKRPAIPIKDKEESNPSKRPKLSDSSITDTAIPGNTAEALIHSAEDNKMDISPIKSDKMDASPSEGSQVMAVSPDNSKLTEEIQFLVKSVPVMEKDEIEIDMSSKSDENLNQTEIDHLVDDPSQVDSVRKAVEDRLKADLIMKKTKAGLSPSKDISNRSPRKSRRINSPGMNTEILSGCDDPDIIPSHPNILMYLKDRFSSVLCYRDKHMLQIYKSLVAFQGDLSFLYYYAKNASLLVENHPIEDKEYFTEDLQSLKDDILNNAKKLSDNLRVSLNIIKSDIPFWSKGLIEIQKLKEKYEPLISDESDSERNVEFRRQYESKLRIIWEQMDCKIILRNGLRPSLLEISADYVKLTKDFVKYLVMVQILKPSLNLHL